MRRPREIYADLIGELNLLRDTLSLGGDAPAETLRRRRLSLRCTNELFVILVFGEETEGYWKNVIEPAAMGLSLKPVRIDKEETEIAIGDEIRSAISAALLVVCDLSFERPNCYFEAGYASPNRLVVMTRNSAHARMQGCSRLAFPVFSVLHRLHKLR